MATPKTWTATDIVQGKLTIHRVTNPETGNPAIQVERRYKFVDAADQVLDIAGGRVLAVVDIANIPANVVSALQTIDQWTYNRTLVQEDME